MKTGKDIRELANEIYRQQNAKRDFVAPTEKASVVAEFAATAEHEEELRRVKIDLADKSFTVGDVAHTQIREHTGIPAAYYDKLRREAPDLYCQNVNHWFTHDSKPRMFRTLDGRLRAFLSDRFNISLENGDLAEAAIPALIDGQVEIISCEITEKRLYIKAVDKRINLDIPFGHKLGDGSHKFFDTCSPAIIISNSEVGLGRLSVETALWTHMCTNLAIAKQRSLARHHIGARHEIAGDDIREMLSDDTKKKTDIATLAQIGDVVKGAFDKAKFASLVDKVRVMADDEIKKPLEVVELTARRFSLNDTEKGSVLEHLIKGADLSRYGLFNAITRASADVESYDRATEMERMGGEIIDLPASEWKEIAIQAETEGVAARRAA